jgi:hypothetical protein
MLLEEQKQSAAKRARHHSSSTPLVLVEKPTPAFPDKPATVDTLTSVPCGYVQLWGQMMRAAACMGWPSCRPACTAFFKKTHVQAI